ncbi:type II toxin-antitoxin system RelE/ParE family toxin [Nitrospirillum amazonense]|uniref:type II toxin-antitoxin system RelE/ParE family toxin n=1 Tax=Nitrospirillum amazonense TaxID=28077 RepID=UPI002DD425FC|nr:type II toxin-antitoxin system RelE/ParE family toxin [Nitrospirillum amazonense]MEC4594444.1 type II toxin-antitoxin system RelE/ParE family toxin [Nitrospirillum amazonense]
MGEYALSGKARDDLKRIAQQSLTQWGMAQAERYIYGLHELFGRLVTFPDLGRDAGEIRPGYLRIESGSHVIFYRKAANGILVVRVLHAHMDLSQHL